jgi:hypothetical protein
LVKISRSNLKNLPREVVKVIDEIVEGERSTQELKINCALSMTRYSIQVFDVPMTWNPKAQQNTDNKALEQHQVRQ